MNGVLRFLVRRLLRAVVTLWFAATTTFLLLRLLPGDPALAVADPKMSKAMRQEILHQYGLDQPLLVQYGKYLWQLAHGNLGLSFAQSVPVAPVLGVLAATHAGGSLDRLLQVGGVLGQSLFVPSVGILLLYFLGLELGWFPIGGAFTDGSWGLGWYASVAHHLVLPACSLVLVQLGSYVVTLRSTLTEALGEDYCRLATAKGVPQRSVVWKHALRNALLPTTTLAGMQIGFLVGGAVLTETVYGYPGVGRGIYEAVRQLDYPVLQGAFLLLAVTVVVANLLTDVAYGVLDPRIRTS